MKSHVHRRSLRVTLLVALVLPLFFGTVTVVATTSHYAMMMPRAAQSLLLDVALAGSRLVAVGERGHILYSEDSGDHWVQAKVPTNVMLTRVFFISSDTGWAVGHDGNILLTGDGGVSWTLQRDGISDQALINEQRAGRAKQTVDALRQQLTAVATDAQKQQLLLELEEAEYALGGARAALDEAVYAPPLMDIWFSDEQRGWASGAYGTLLYTTNGGRQWLDGSHKVGNQDQLHLNGIAGTANDTLFLASEWGTVFRSNTGGESWESIETGYEGSFFGVLVNPQTGSVFAYGLRGTVYRSKNNGDSWSELHSQARASLFGAEASPDGELVFVGSGGSVSLSKNDGDSFTALPQARRTGVYGIARMADGRYMLTGEGGSRLLLMNGATPSNNSSGPAAPSQESQP